MSRIVKEHDERKNEILDVAQVLFYSKGYKQTSIQEIIDGVGIAKGTFYHYFSSKNQLLDELIARMIDQTIEMVEPVVSNEDLDALQKFHLFFRTIENWKLENKTFFKSILQIFYSDSNALLRQKLMAASMSAINPSLARIVRQGVDEGVFDTPFPDEIGATLYIVSQSLSVDLAHFMLSDNGREELRTLERRIEVSQYALERILGAREGSIHIFDMDRLRQWFEADEPRLEENTAVGTFAGLVS